MRDMSISFSMIKYELSLLPLASLPNFMSLLWREVPDWHHAAWCQLPLIINESFCHLQVIMLLLENYYTPCWTNPLKPDPPRNFKKPAEKFPSLLPRSLFCFTPWVFINYPPILTFPTLPAWRERLPAMFFIIKFAFLSITYWNVRFCLLFEGPPPPPLHANVLLNGP